MWAEAARGLLAARAAGTATWRRPPPGLCRRLLMPSVRLGPRGLASLKVAPAIAPAGLPEAVALGIADVPLAQPAQGGGATPTPMERADLPVDQLDLKKATAALRQLGGREEVDMDEVQPLVSRSLDLANDASCEELAELAEAFAAARLRLPLRDLMPKVSARLSSEHDPKVLPSVGRLLTATGRGSLYYSDLFEFCKDHLHSLAPDDLATYVYEGGRHGLRCRHLLDAALGRAVELVPQMGLNDVMRAWQGFVRFSRDRREYYKAALPRVRSELGRLTVPHLLLTMRAARDLKNLDEFVELHAACATELIVKMDSLSLSDAAQCVALCTFSPRYRAQAQGLVRSVEQKWSGTQDLAPLRVVEAVDALETFASWGMRPMPLVDRLDELLVERQVELKYTGNVSLWVVATQALSRMEHVDAKWPRIAVEFARDPIFVEKISFFQQSALISALGRLRLFDEAVYRNVADALVSDFSLFKEVQDLAPVLWAYATANYIHKGLFDSAYDLMITWLEGEHFNLEHKPTHGAIIQVVWSFVVANYHIRYESFAAFLDYAFFVEPMSLRVAHLRRLAQLSDAVFLEAPETASLCQYHDRIGATLADQRVRNIVSSDPPSQPELLQEIRGALQQLGWPYDVFVVPDGTAAFYVDISLAQHAGQKVGLLLAGRYELLTVGLPGEAHEPRETGLFTLARRLHARHGWRTAVIEPSSWAELSSIEQRRAFLEDAVQRALKEPLPSGRSSNAPAAAVAGA